jgi:hypothetical protein
MEGTSTSTAITDSGGGYQLGVPPGTVKVFVVAETLPAGYDIANLPPRSRRLVREEAAVVNFTVRAQRSIDGIVSCGNGQAVPVSAEGFSRRAVTDPHGHFVLRGLPAGQLTLTAECPSGAVRKSVDIPAEPGVVRGIRMPT